MADPDSRTGTDYTSRAIDQYVEELYASHDESLGDAIEKLEAFEMPKIQVSPMDGKILSVLLGMIRAEKVIEIGTLSGYSGLWMLKAMPKSGHLWTLEHSDKHADVAEGVFERAGYKEQVSILRGSALEILPVIEKHALFDAVFIDADKENYHRYVRWAFDNLRSGGLIIADNAYLFGYLAGREPDDKWNEENIGHMREAHEFLATHCLSACLPTPDGLAVGVKP